MAEQWQMVRLRKETHERLADLLERMERARIEGRARYERMNGDTLTLDAVVRTLIDRDSRHRRRKREHAARKAHAKRMQLVYTLDAATECSQAIPDRTTE